MFRRRTHEVECPRALRSLLKQDIMLSTMLPWNPQFAATKPQGEGEKNARNPKQPHVMRASAGRIFLWFNQ